MKLTGITTTFTLFVSTADATSANHDGFISVHDDGCHIDNDRHATSVNHDDRHAACAHHDGCYRGHTAIGVHHDGCHLNRHANLVRHFYHEYS